MHSETITKYTDELVRDLPPHLHTTARTFFLQVLLDLLKDEELALWSRANSFDAFSAAAKSKINDAITDRFLRNAELMEAMKDPDHPARQEIMNRLTNDLTGATDAV